MELLLLVILFLGLLVFFLAAKWLWSQKPAQTRSSKHETISTPIQKMPNAASSSSNLTLPHLILNFEDLVAGGFPVHPDTTGRPSDYSEEGDFDDDWYDTSDIGLDRKTSHFTLNCKMVETRKGKQVGRVSLIDSNGDVILDEFVKPRAYVTNYLTESSGLTQKDIFNAPNRLGDIQEKITDVVSSDDILIGHAVYSDLRALKLRHPKIIDTAHIYGDLTNLNSQAALKHLAKEYLGVDVQDGSLDSVEDARVTLELVEFQLRKRRRR